MVLDHGSHSLEKLVTSVGWAQFGRGVFVLVLSFFLGVLSVSAWVSGVGGQVLLVPWVDHIFVMGLSVMAGGSWLIVITWAVS